MAGLVLALDLPIVAAEYQGEHKSARKRQVRIGAVGISPPA